MINTSTPYESHDSNVDFLLIIYLILTSNLNNKTKFFLLIVSETSIEIQTINETQPTLDTI